jgi:hypothetical protein
MGKPNLYNTDEERLEARRETVRAYYQRNKEKCAERKKIYNQKNKVELQKKRNEYRKKRKKTDELYKLTNSIRRNINNAFKRNGYNKTSKTFELLSCSFEEFKTYLESSWESWMNWDNYGLYNGEPNYGWDIDHIIPSSSAMTEEELIKLNHFTNLQPLCSYINRKIKRDY